MSITFLLTGALGNFIFKHNAAYVYAKENGLELQVYREEGLKTWATCHSIDWYKDLFKHVKYVGNYDRDSVYEEPNFTWDPLPEGVKVINGSFQSWKYFDKYTEEIRDLFRKNDSATFTKMVSKYQEVCSGKETVCIHIRRGDYLLAPDYHTLVGEEYYTKSLENFNKNNVKLLIFSDTLQMVEGWALWKTGWDAHFVTDVPHPLEAIFLMSLCDNFIIANSSMSLAAYYMRSRKDARIFAPENWFGPRGPKYKMSDIIK